MMATIKLIKTPITSHSYLFGSLRTPGIYYVSQFQVYNTLLLTIVMSGECVISLVLSHHNKKLKRWTSVIALGWTSVIALCDGSVLFRK